MNNLRVEKSLLGSIDHSDKLWNLEINTTQVKLERISRSLRRDNNRIVILNNHSKVNA